MQNDIIPLPRPPSSFKVLVSKYGKTKIISTVLGMMLMVGGVGAGIVLVTQPQLLSQQAAVLTTSYNLCEESDCDHTGFACSTTGGQCTGTKPNCKCQSATCSPTKKCVVGTCIGGFCQPVTTLTPINGCTVSRGIKYVSQKDPRWKDDPVKPGKNGKPCDIEYIGCAPSVMAAAIATKLGSCYSPSEVSRKVTPYLTCDGMVEKDAATTLRKMGIGTTPIVHSDDPTTMMNNVKNAFIASGGQPIIVGVNITEPPDANGNRNTVSHVTMIVGYNSQTGKPIFNDSMFGENMELESRGYTVQWGSADAGTIDLKTSTAPTPTPIPPSSGVCKQFWYCNLNGSVGQTANAYDSASKLQCGATNPITCEQGLAFYLRDSVTGTQFTTQKCYTSEALARTDQYCKSTSSIVVPTPTPVPTPSPIPLSCHFEGCSTSSHLGYYYSYNPTCSGSCSLGCGNQWPTWLGEDAGGNSGYTNTNSDDYVRTYACQLATGVLAPTPLPTPIPTPVPINGACGTSPNSCISGFMASPVVTTTSYQWYCKSPNGGNTVSCSMPKCTQFWYCNLNGTVGQTSSTYDSASKYQCGVANPPTCEQSLAWYLHDSLGNQYTTQKCYYSQAEAYTDPYCKVK